MFEKTLTDVVKGIRASRRDTSLYISQCIAEIKTEINSSDMFVKANALQKLTFLQMMGYGMSWASFASIELMSSSRFAHKRIAYLSASQGFTQDTDVILLTTNLLKKELRGGVYEAGLAVNCISNIVTEDLARDILPELTSLTNHPQPYLRKKAILCLFKAFVKYPQGLRLTFDKIQLCLEDQNPSVVSCAVNVMAELSEQNAKNLLHLAPAFFQLLTTSSNNWMLIKVVKLLGSLVPEEPRLARKLLEPLSDIVRSTKAKSLLFEAVHTVTLCLPYCRRSDGSMPDIVPEIVTLCAETLQGFVNESDQNLKYLGLVGFASLMQSHPRVLSAPGYRPIILVCLSDQDVTIRTRALSLLPGMASRKNLMELVSQLLKHVDLATGSYKLDLVSTIIEMCTGEKYALLADFAWYLNILFQLGHMRGLDAHSALLRTQILDVALRVLPVRAFAVKRSIEILLEGENLPSSSSSGRYGDNGRGRHIMPEVLPALAWIVGEYSDLIRKALSITECDTGEEFFVDESSKGTYHSLIQTFTTSSNFQKLAAVTQKVYLQAALKVFAAATTDQKVSNKELEASCETLKQNLPLYMQSIHVEVQERAFTGHALLASMGLIAAKNSMPSLTAAGDNSDSDDDGGVEEDLLGMGGSISIQKSKPQAQQSLLSSQGGLASKCRQQAPVLNYVLKPSPMKPTSAKSQRKKSQAPIGINAGEVAIVDLSVFSVLIADELVSSSGLKVSMEAVSFTQQTQVRVVDTAPPPTAATPTKMQGFGSTGGGSMPGFQRPPAPQMFETSGTGLRQNQTDPFYLDSAPKIKAQEGQDPGQFGMIQLSDSDDDDASASNKRKKKKKKSKKDNHLAAVASFTSDPNAMSIGGTGVAVYDSDDGEDSGLQSFGTTRRNAPRSRPRNGAAQEFAGLAQVDLTEPLREDEVMPERKHRVVPDRAAVDASFGQEKASKKTKKSKKGKKSKKKSKKDSLPNAAEPFANVGDLLDLFGGAAASAAPVTKTTTTSAPLPNFGNPASSNISDAFGDLLGLQEPAPTMAVPFTGSSTNAALSAPLIASGGQAWIKATVKNSKSGTPSNFDLSCVSVNIQVYPASHGQGTAVMIAARVVNGGATELQSTSVHLGEGKSVILGNIAPGSTAVSKKVGPFAYGEVDASFDLKGSMSSSGATVSVKISMPISTHLTAWNGLTLDDVSNELSSGNIMDSRSVKIPFSPKTQPSSVKSILMSHLCAAEVAAGASLITGTLAAQSRGGIKLLMLLKVKDGVAKVDLKCSSQSFGKELASELKKLLLE